MTLGTQSQFLGTGKYFFESFYGIRSQIGNMEDPPSICMYIYFYIYIIIISRYFKL